jgi:hypothetical protein
MLLLNVSGMVLGPVYRMPQHCNSRRFHNYFLCANLPLVIFTAKYKKSDFGDAFIGAEIVYA